MPVDQVAMRSDWRSPLDELVSVSVHVESSQLPKSEQFVSIS